MPAGEDVIAESPTGGVMMTSKDGKIRRHVVGIPLEFPNRQSGTRLVFRRHGGDYFLAQMRSVGQSAYVPSLFWGIGPIDPGRVTPPPAPSV